MIIWRKRCRYYSRPRMDEETVVCTACGQEWEPEERQTVQKKVRQIIPVIVDPMTWESLGNGGYWLRRHYP
jgi:DNA-directed RNA polymerase